MSTQLIINLIKEETTDFSYIGIAKAIQELNSKYLFTDKLFQSSALSVSKIKSALNGGIVFINSNEYVDSVFEKFISTDPKTLMRELFALAGEPTSNDVFEIVMKRESREFCKVVGDFTGDQLIITKTFDENICFDYENDSQTSHSLDILVNSIIPTLAYHCFLSGEYVYEKKFTEQVRATISSSLYYL